jgi:hypothetical protein
VGRRRVPLLVIAFVAVAASQVVLGIALLSADPPTRTTTLVSPLPMENQKVSPAAVEEVRRVAMLNNADLIILVVDPCTVSLWPCPPPTPRSQPPTTTIQDTTAKDGESATSTTTTQLQDPQQTDGHTGPPTTPPTSQRATTPATPQYPGAADEYPRIQLVIDDREPRAVAASQPNDTRVLDAQGNVVQPGSTEDGPGVLLFVWAAGLVGVIGTGGWTLATATRGGPAYVSVPVPPSNDRRSRNALSPASPRQPATVRPDAGSADLIDIFLQHVPRERPRTREPQCPRCGSFDAQPATPASRSADTSYRCRYCSCDWTTTTGAPWPTVVINPRAGH